MLIVDIGRVPYDEGSSIERIPPKLKMLTGTYILQIIRTKMYADEDAKCQLCKVETETLELFW
jgi:hypothetical protein